MSLTISDRKSLLASHSTRSIVIEVPVYEHIKLMSGGASNLHTSQLTGFVLDQHGAQWPQVTRGDEVVWTLEYVYGCQVSQLEQTRRRYHRQSLIVR